MSLPNITINRAKSGLGRALPGKDHVSGIYFFLTGLFGASVSHNDTLMRVYTSIEGAEADGITKGDAANGVAWEHINDFFTNAPGATLYVYCMNAGSDLVTAVGFPAIVNAGIKDAQELAQGELRQLAIVTKAITGGMTPAQETAMVAAIKTATETLEAEAKPLIVVAESISYNEDDSGATATNLTSPGIPRLVMIAGLTFAKGSVLTDSNLAFFTPIGAILGFIAAAKVHESIGWVERFNLAASGHATGQDVDVQPERGYRLAFQQKGYLVLTTYTGISGVFVAVSNTAAAPTSDFARIENVRTMDKAARNLRTLLLPKINSPLYVEANGKLDRATIEVFKALGIQALDSLLVAGEISAYVIDVDPDQNVLTSGVLQIGVRIVPVGSAEQITANLSYTLSIA